MGTDDRGGTMARQQSTAGQRVDVLPAADAHLAALAPPPASLPRPEPPRGLPMAGRTVVVTGASSGIGAEAVRQVAALGARIVALGRSPRRTLAIAAETGATPIVADFARLADVRAAAAQVAALCPRIDVLMNNAGGLYPHRVVTEDGNELTFQVNHLAPFLLTGLLLPRLRESPGSRVVVTSSFMNLEGRIDLADLEADPAGVSRRHRPFVAYSTTKLANILFVKELARRSAAGGPTATAVHPGVVLSRFGQDHWLVRAFYRKPLLAFGARTSASGALPLVEVATRPDPETVNGTFRMRFHQGERLFSSRQAHDAALARGLWAYSCARVGLPVGAATPTRPGAMSR
jgi:NAD(P)-dependent dehydrogenase (short-subunit alcohol dehydrogenase family)